VTVQRRYGFLRAIAFLLKLLAWLALLAGLTIAAVSLLMLAGLGSGILNLDPTVRLLGASLAPAVGIAAFVKLYAFGSILSLLIDIEENTRRLAP
jgi:hypothetical protein